MAKQLSHSFCQQILTLEDKRIQLKTALEDADNIRKKATELNSQLYDKLTWWERTFGGFLFGKSMNLDDFEKQSKLCEQKEQEYQVIADELASVKSNIATALHAELMALDVQYKTLYETLQRINRVLNAAHRCDQEIDEAQDALDHATSMETLDLISDNKMLSYLSYSSTSSAQYEVDEAVSAIEHFNKELKAFESFFEEIKTRTFDGLTLEGLDLIVDFAFDTGFDFLSVFNVLALSSARSDLDRAEASVVSVIDALEPNRQEYQKQIDEYYAKIRSAIREGLTALET